MKLPRNRRQQETNNILNISKDTDLLSESLGRARASRYHFFFFFYAFIFLWTQIKPFRNDSIKYSEHFCWLRIFSSASILYAAILRVLFLSYNVSYVFLSNKWILLRIQLIDYSHSYNASNTRYINTTAFLYQRRRFVFPQALLVSSHVDLWRPLYLYVLYICIYSRNVIFLSPGEHKDLLFHKETPLVHNSVNRYVYLLYITFFLQCTQFLLLL